MKKQENNINTSLPTMTLYEIFKSWLMKFACHHKWFTYYKCDVLDHRDEIIGFEHTLICEKCGKIKKIRL